MVEYHIVAHYAASVISMSFVRHLLQAPIFIDEDQTRAARTLNSLLLTFLAGALVYLPISLAADVGALRWVLVIGAGGVCAGLVWGLRQGWVKAVAAAVSMLLWVIFTVSAFARGGIQSPGFAGYSAAILVAGMTLNWRAGLGLTGLSIVTGLAIVYGEASGAIEPRHFHPLEVWAAGSVFFVVIALVSRQTIEELVQTKQALQRREREYRSLVENSTDFIARLDSRLRYQFVSPSLSRAMGIAVRDYVGRTNRELNFPAEMAELWDREARKVFETRSVSSVEFRYPTANGPRDYHARLTPEFGADGAVETVLGIIRDVTELKQAERERVETEQQRELVELKERFIATASHDFRTPLTIIKADASMLQTYAERMPEAARRGKLVEIQHQVNRMIDLLNGVLMVSKANAGKEAFAPGLVELRGFCQRLWEDMVQIDGGQHAAQHTYQAAVEYITADATLLRYILVNLLSNAFKYTPAGGAVQFQVTNDEHWVLFEVTDTGCGIPEADIKRLFEPFHRSANVRHIEGTGLGLVIAKRYVELHQGEIEVMSVEGSGSTFRARIPLEEGGASSL